MSERVSSARSPIGERVSARVRGRALHAALGAARRRTASVLVRSCVHNTADVPPGLDRGEALARVADLDPHGGRDRRRGGSSRRWRPGGRASTSGRCWPRRGRRAVLGAAIVLPDHPRISAAQPRQPVRQHRDRGGAVLHVHALTDEERAAAAAQTRWSGRCSSARWRSAPRRSWPCTAASTDVATPEAPRPRGAGDDPGEQHADLDGVTLRRAATRWCCAPAPTATVSTGCSTAGGRRSSGSTSTTTTASTSAVTVDDDPGQELMRETGRYLFFFARRGGARMTETTSAPDQADPRRRDRQRLAARRRLRGRGRQAAVERRCPTA